MCTLTIVLLVFPGTSFDSLWRFNPAANSAFRSIGPAAVLLMLLAATACGLGAAGLWRNSLWGIWVALTILSVNMVGDLFNALIRHDYRSLIGVPVGGATIFYLARSKG
jgi:hypothetical protein